MPAAPPPGLPEPAAQRPRPQARRAPPAPPPRRRAESAPPVALGLASGTGRKGGRRPRPRPRPAEPRPPRRGCGRARLLREGARAHFLLSSSFLPLPPLGARAAEAAGPERGVQGGGRRSKGGGTPGSRAARRPGPEGQRADQSARAGLALPSGRTRRP